MVKKVDKIKSRLVKKRVMNKKFSKNYKRFNQLTELNFEGRYFPYC